ncbi:MAG: S8 family serine peptidase [Candidatus Lokiarchaeota archaeon]|nr:S8 family serine peptidase [Candidatus Lokiarchaeota archaeon]
MNYIRSKSNLLLISFFLISSVVSPIWGSGIIFNENPPYLNRLELNANELPIFKSNSAINYVSDSNPPINKDNLIFDDLLIKELATQEQNGVTEIKTIMLFEETTSKSERIEFIDKVLEDYVILDNYDIIPAVYIKCQSSELTSKIETLKSFSTLKKVYKSRNYIFPYFQNEFPSSSALNADFYSNWWLPAIGAEHLAFDGTGVRVAVIDTGIYDHPDLNLTMNRNFVSNESVLDYNDYDDLVGHGTHVAGIIGGNGGGSGGLYKGVAPGVSLINARAGDATGLEEGDIISAIEWSANTANADIISMSFGDRYPIASDPMILALASVTENGVITVSSAGNSGPEYFSGGSPASGIDVISVGATDSSNNLASFSSWGPSLSYLGYLDVVAPGVNIISTEAPESIISDRNRFLGGFFDFSGDADYIPLSGTSMACPIVAGALAIMKQAYPSISPETARIALLEGAQDLANTDDSEFMKSGFGLINITASLEYLDYLNANFSNINDVAKLSPDKLPIKPFDLINFPGDVQEFNLSIISGTNNTLNVNHTNYVDGISLSLDKSQIIFNNAGVQFVKLRVEINANATPGLQTFELNITSGIREYDTITISIDIRFPEHRVLMESYHGLNDWFPELSFYQMDSYRWMEDLSHLNISIDYLAEFWSPNYDSNLENSILTEERLAQYDLVVLQNPILPYNPLEFINLKNYFENGGNLLFLGTRYQDLCVENLNELFSYIDLGITINEENVANEEWIGVGATVSTQSITNFNNSLIFQGVSKFSWEYGSTLSVMGNAEAIASAEGKTIAAAYDHNPFGGGRFVAVGDLHWITDLYDSQVYKQDHSILTRNLMDFFFESENVSIEIIVDSESTPSSQINISLYIKNQTLDAPVSSTVLNSYLNVSLQNDSYFESIQMISSSDGIAINHSITLPSPNAKPYTIDVNITIGSQTYTKSSKILYYNNSKVPQISSIISTTDIERNSIDSLNIDATLDNIAYNATAYLSMYPLTYYTESGTVNKTFPLSNTLFEYSYDYIPTSSDVPGYAIFYIVPFNPISNYYNPYSPRIVSLINNNPPEFIEESSIILIDNSQSITFDETHDEDRLHVFTISQGSRLDFRINITDSVSYEDQNGSEMIVSVNIFIASLSEDKTIVPINPKTNIFSEMIYELSSNTHTGSFIIPYTMEFSTITGPKLLSTASQYDSVSQDGYLAFLLVTAFDSEGESEDFLIVVLIQPSLPIDLMLVLIIISVVVVIALILGVSMYLRKKRKSYLSTPSESYYQYHYDNGSSPESDDYTRGLVTYCPYCGYGLATQQNFCPSCGKSLTFHD